ncbi:MAG TPA: DUF4232 domain-containing protein [Acidimicrobiales bacterium]|nr:DUF4232 domain-containing protein [Acidimicrobiales bacterium]
MICSRRSRSERLLALAVGVVTAALTTGCAAPGPPAGEATGAASGRRAASLAPGRPAAASATTTTPTVDPDPHAGLFGRASSTFVPPCTAGTVQITINIQPRGSGQPAAWTRALVVVRAATSAVCTLAGFPHLSAQVDGRHGDRRTVLTVRPVARPRHPAAVRVRAGSPAFAMLAWRSRPTCPLVDTLDVRLPGPGQRRIAAQLLGAADPGASVRVCAAARMGPFASVPSAAHAVLPG